MPTNYISLCIKLILRMLLDPNVRKLACKFHLIMGNVCLIKFLSGFLNYELSEAIYRQWCEMSYEEGCKDVRIIGMEEHTVSHGRKGEHETQVSEVMKFRL